jgi:Uma2 family endonuclease
MTATAAVDVPRTGEEVEGWVTLRNVPYKTYLRLVREPKNFRLRMAYSQGTLEIMSPRREHEQPASRIGMIVRALTCELGIPCSGMRTTTFHRAGKGRTKGYGKEPDECFYLANEARILGKETVDLDAGDPPPDLWIEVDHRGNALGKLALYAGLGVPELWRYRTKDHSLLFLALDPAQGKYEPIPRSLSLPMLSPEAVLEALAMCAGISESIWDRRLRAWIRERLVPPPDEAR